MTETLRPYFVDVETDSLCDPSFPPGCRILVDPNAAPAVGRYLAINDDGRLRLRLATGQDIIEPPAGCLGVAIRRIIEEEVIHG